MDHYYYKDNFTIISKATSPAITIAPDGVVWASIPDFVNAIKAQAAMTPLDPLDRLQKTDLYEYYDF